MRLALAIITLGCSLAWSQTVVKLRTGDYQSMYRITALTSATPAVATVKNWQGLTQHALTNGLTIYIHGVPGCHNANGFKKIKSVNQGAGTLALTDEADVDFTCGETFDTGGTSVWQSGFLGRVESYTLQPSPGMMVPQSGTVRNRVVDSDGLGGGVGTAVTALHPAWSGLLAALGGAVSACCSESATFGRTTTGTGNAEVILGYRPFAASQVWEADNSKTTYLDYAKYALNHAEMMLGNNNIQGIEGPGFCDQSAQFCAIASGSDYTSISLQNIALTYDKIKGQMGAVDGTDRTALRGKLLNGLYEPCNSQMSQTPTGVASITIGTKQVDGTNLGGYTTGGWIYLKTTLTNGSTGTLYRIASVESATRLFIDINASATVASKNHHYIAPWTTGSCGLIWTGLGHLWPFSPRSWTATTSVRVAADTTFPVTYVSGLPTSYPYYIRSASEVVKVTGRTGLNLTVERSQLYTTAPASLASGTKLYWAPNIASYNSSTTTGPVAVNGAWWNNLHHMKVVDQIMLGVAFAEEDARAKTMLEEAWNYYYDLVLTYNKDYWSGYTQGGISPGYQWGRWQDPIMKIGAIGEWAFDRANTLFGSYIWDTLSAPFYWANPDTWTKAFYDSTTQAEDHSISNIVPWISAGQVFNSGQAITAQANYYMRTLTGLYTVFGFTSGTGPRAAPWALAYSASTDTSTDFRPTEPPWRFYTENEYDYNKSTGATDAYHGLTISKTDWTPTATYVYFHPGMSDSTDHIVGDAPGAPGSYGIKKGSKTLIGDNYSKGVCQGCIDDLKTNYFEILTAMRNSTYHPAWSVGTTFGGGDGGQQNVVDRKIGNVNYTYSRGNFTASYKSEVGALRTHRGVLHWKRTPELVVAFDNSVLTLARAMRTRLHWYREGVEAATSDFTRTGNAITFKKTSGAGAAMVATQLLFPDGQTPNIAYPTITDSHSAGCGSVACTALITWSASPVLPSTFTVTIASPAVVTIASHGLPVNSTVVISSFTLPSGLTGGVTYFVRNPNPNTFELSLTSGGASINTTGSQSGTHTMYSAVNSAQMFAVHFPSLGTSASLPATTTLTGVDADSVGFEVSNGDTSRAAVFAKTGVLRTTVEFTTTFAGDGYCIASDMAPSTGTATYDVFRNLVAHAGNPFTVVAGENTFEFPCDGAAPWTINQSGAAPACVITTTSLTGGTVGAAYSQTPATNCSSPVWSVLSGSLPAGFNAINSSTGALTGTPTTVGLYSFTLQAVGTENTATKALSIDITGADVQPISILGLPPNQAVIGLPYAVGLTATGGVAPYLWSMPTPTACGVTITAGGILTGPATVLGPCILTLRVTDSAATAHDEASSLQVVSIAGSSIGGHITGAGGIKTK